MKELRNKDGLTEAEFLAEYNPGNYERPSVTTDILILGMNKDYSSLKLLLIKRGDHHSLARGHYLADLFPQMKLLMLQQQEN